MTPHKLLELSLRSAAIGYVSLLILLPLAAIAHQSFIGGIAHFIEDISSPQASSALILTLEAAFLTTVINAILGTLSAIVLVRYEFPGRWFLNALVDLPFAIPTLVTGLMIAAVYGPTSMAGTWLQQGGLTLLYAKPGIVLAMLLVTMPFTIRSLQPVLIELEREQEDAAFSLGASPWTTFWKVTVPSVLPGLLTGVFLTFVRALGEFGSIVIVAGNIPMKTQVASVYVYGEIESYNPQGATSVSVFILLISFLVLILLERLTRPPGERMPRWLRWPNRPLDMVRPSEIG
ncbi:MAG: sulfate ABC transporter permease subunit CysT [Nitrospira sp.]|nr:sulfate ABC transporter permease subunit CysT [Nitrospira sp.]MDH4235936.1 sulfate ABC transporter permease subunit CysT [Nitrospira sp.]MDH4328104.1 sulfate ABC transporter permease subunit CysT [Nitrospira sp.]MDH5252386.1 sulfate ABC transporter permease subunit CysT [Nitrospira sp.]